MGIDTLIANTLVVLELGAVTGETNERQTDRQTNDGVQFIAGPYKTQNTIIYYYVG